MPEMHLKQPQFTYSACGPFTKNKERIQKFKETGDSRYIFKNELYSLCKFKDLTKRITVHKVLKNKVFNIAKNPKYDGYERGLASMVYNFLIKRLQVVVLSLYHKMNN